MKNEDRQLDRSENAGHTAALLNGRAQMEAIKRAFPSPRPALLAESKEGNDMGDSRETDSHYNNAHGGESAAHYANNSPASGESSREYNRRKQREHRERMQEALADRAYLRRAAHHLMINISRGGIAPAELAALTDGADPVYMLETLGRYFAGRLPFQKEVD